MNDKISLLKKVDIFSSLSDDDLETASEFCDYIAYEKGDQIFEEGTFGKSLFIIKSGSVIISKLEEMKSREVARFIPGESFGEMDLLENSPRSAAATAAEDVTLLVFPLPGKELKDVLQNAPVVSARILREILSMIAARIRSTNALVSEKSSWLQEMRKQLIIDKLTGLYNRTFIEEDFSEIIKTSGDYTSLVMVKPDKFKLINDTYGHEAGDGVLVLMAETFRNLMKKDFKPVRYRGNELAAILPGIDYGEAKKVAESYKKDMSAMDISSLTNGGQNNMTFSLGVSTYPDHGNDSKSLVHVTYEKLYKSIEDGGDTITF